MFKYYPICEVWECEECGCEAGWDFTEGMYCDNEDCDNNVTYNPADDDDNHFHKENW